MPLAVTVRPGREPELEDRLRATREDTRHPARDELQVLVEGQHVDILGVALIELADRRDRAVGERDARIRGETTGLAQVGEHRPLVLAVFELPVQL